MHICLPFFSTCTHSIFVLCQETYILFSLSLCLVSLSAVSVFSFPGFLGCLGTEKEQENMASSSSSSWKGLEEEDRLHVLAVDDSSVDRKLIERLLTNSACKVTTAENGQRALELLGLGDEHHSINNRGSKVNLIITDYCMPGMTGYELLKKVKESSNLKEIPVVIVSSENVPTRIKKCLEEGAQEFMLKPLKQSDVKKLRCFSTVV